MKVSEALERDYALQNKMCVFCENVLSLKSVYCADCNEYKGVMTIQDFLRTYGSPIY